MTAHAEPIQHIRSCRLAEADALGRQLVAPEPARAAALHLRGVGAPKSRRRVRAHPGLQELSLQVRRVLETEKRSNRLHPDWNR
jgi:hypothetical protein